MKPVLRLTRSGKNFLTRQKLLWGSLRMLVGLGRGSPTHTPARAQKRADGSLPIWDQLTNS